MIVERPVKELEVSQIEIVLALDIILLDQIFMDLDLNLTKK